jgi:hypothetical protein
MPVTFDSPACDDSGSKKYKEGYDGTSGGIWHSMRLAGDWSHELGFALVRLAEIRNVAINCITVQDK